MSTPFACHDTLTYHTPIRLAILCPPQILCQNANDCYDTLDTRLTKFVASHKASWGASRVTFQDCGNAAFNNLLTDLGRSYADLVGILLDSGVRVMVYCGVNDILCNCEVSVGASVAAGRVRRTLQMRPCAACWTAACHELGFVEP